MINLFCIFEPAQLSENPSLPPWYNGSLDLADRCKLPQVRTWLQHHIALVPYISSAIKLYYHLAIVPIQLWYHLTFQHRIALVPHSLSSIQLQYSSSPIPSSASTIQLKYHLYLLQYSIRRPSSITNTSTSSIIYIVSFSSSTIWI